MAHARQILIRAGLAGLASAGALAQPAISVDPSAGRHPISPYIYGMAEYGVSPAYQAEAILSVLRWGGDGTTRYNWQVDSSNAGFDWFFMGGGNPDPVPSGAPDALVAAGQGDRRGHAADHSHHSLYQQQCCLELQLSRRRHADRPARITGRSRPPTLMCFLPARPAATA